MHRECDCASLLRLSLFSLVFQSVIARLDPESCSHALEPDRDTGSLLQVAVAPGRSSIDSKEDEFLARAGIEEKKRFWWKLTQDLDKKHGFPISHGETTLRRTIDLWDAQVARSLAEKKLTNQRCAETGDGHFLRAHWHSICGTMLVADKYDSKANVKMDLNLPPADAPDSIKGAHNTIDVMVTHQVFEHLRRPSVGFANINAMLRKGGHVVVSTPFVVQDHVSPFKDYFRYTVHSIHTLLSCAGFEVQQLRGQGNRLQEIAYLAYVSSDMMDDQDLASGCDGLKSNDCKNKHYSGVAAVGIKKESKTLEEIQRCWG